MGCKLYFHGEDDRREQQNRHPAYGGGIKSGKRLEGLSTACRSCGLPATME